MMNRRTPVRGRSHWRLRSLAVIGSRVEPAGFSPRRSWGIWAAGVAAIAALAIAAGLLITGGRGTSRLPRSPVAWLDSFSRGSRA
jgi:hypothetical protein